MKTITALIISLTAIIALAAGSAFGSYSGGSGTAGDPYQIADANDLLALAANTADYDKCFILMADVNLQGQTFTTAIIAADTSSSGGFQGTDFMGTFDGNGHKIIHFTINGGNNSYYGLGLFGYVDSGGSVKNLGLENFSVSGTNSTDVGGLVGLNYGSISNCYSTGAVSGGNEVGGLVGYEFNGSISNCYSTGTVVGGSYVGGLAGENNGGSISNCHSTGTVLCGSNSWNVGGLVGYNDYDCIISNCYSTGAVSGYAHVGGLVGASYSSISNCYSTGVVSGHMDIGGLVGYHYGSIGNCYSTGTVSGSSGVGGLAGLNHGTVSNCYSTGSVSGTSYVGGLVGSNESSISGSFWDVNTSGQTTSSGGTGETTAQMKTLSTFTSAGWDFVEIWGIWENQTYPCLRTEPAGDLNHDKKVDFADFAIFAENWLSGE